MEPPLGDGCLGPLRLDVAGRQDPTFIVPLREPAPICRPSLLRPNDFIGPNLDLGLANEDIFLGRE